MPTSKKFSHASERHAYFMKRALALAAISARKKEIPIGAVLVKDGRIIASGHNLTRTHKDPTAHAEIVAIQRAVKAIDNERFIGTSLYVTLEPCAMCAGAIIQARIPELIFGAFDLKAGACGSAVKIIPNKKLNHRPNVVKGVNAAEAAALLTNFFKKRRKEIALSHIAQKTTKKS